MILITSITSFILGSIIGAIIMNYAYRKALEEIDDEYKLVKKDEDLPTKPEVSG